MLTAEGGTPTSTGTTKTVTGSGSTGSGGGQQFAPVTVGQTATPSANVTGANIVTYTQAQIGKPYVWGAVGPDTFDCSGLVDYVYRHFGISVPRTTFQMVDDKSLQPVSRSSLQPGDLIFSHWGDEGPNSHVGIYTGRNSLIEAPQPGENVMETQLGESYWSHVDNIRRVPGVGSSTAGSQATLTSLQQPGSGGTGGSSGTSSSGGGSSTPPPSGLDLLNPATWAVGIINGFDGLTAIGDGVFAAAGQVAKVGNLADHISKLFLPTNLMRAAMFGFGILFVIVGIWNISAELRD